MSFCEWNWFRKKKEKRRRVENREETEAETELEYNQCAVDNYTESGSQGLREKERENQRMCKNSVKGYRQLTQRDVYIYLVYYHFGLIAVWSTLYIGLIPTYSNSQLVHFPLRLLILHFCK